MEINHDDHRHDYDATREEEHDHKHAHGDEAVHYHKHRHRKSGLDDHDNEEEPEHMHPEHSHAHEGHHHDHHDHGLDHAYEDHEHHRKKPNLKDKRAGWGLVIILSLTPCIALLPLTFAAVKYGTMAVILVNISFTVGTVLTIMLFTWLGLKGLSWIKFEFFEDYGDIIAGVIIGLLGVATKVLEL
jgi:ABC-type nickel/cobalt efflux system permease component RcnA